jgi:hypothetical protein
MANTSSQSILSLTTFVDRPTIEIDGVKYEVFSPDSLSLVDYSRLQSLIPRIDALWPSLKSSSLTKEEETELSEAFGSIAAMVLDAPAEVLSKLTDLHRLLVYQAFLGLPQSTLRLVGAMVRRGAIPSLGPSTGVNSSRVLPVSTKGPARQIGSRRSRSGSSGRAR